MILPLPFWVISIVITIIKIILSGTIGAVLTFYVKYSHDPYANSIRWARIGGLYETTTLLKNSRHYVPGRSSFILTIAIIASLSTLIFSILLGALVSLTDEPEKLAPTSAFSTQLIPIHNTSWIGWTALMEPGAAMKDTLILLLNDTRSNPHPQPRTLYSPRTYDYNKACNETMAQLGKISISEIDLTISYGSPHNNCRSVGAMLHSIVYDWDPKRASNQLIFEGVYMVVAPIYYHEHLHFDIDPYIIGSNGQLCEAPMYLLGLGYTDFPKDGMTALPRTYVTKCRYSAGESIAMSVTVIKFAVNRVNDFDKVTTSMFDDPSNLPLLQVMDTTINNGTFLSSTNNETIVMLTRISADVDFLMCASRFMNQTRDMGLMCSYSLTSVMSITPQPWDHIMVTDLKMDAVDSVNASHLINMIDLSIQHTPSVSQNPMLSFSAAHLIKATTDATEYVASLGHNVILNKKTGQLYILFETVKFNDAFEVSLALLIFLAIVVVVCLIVWGLSEYLYKPVFNGSLYKIVFKEIQSQDEKTPMLMNCKHDPLAFEGFRVIPSTDYQPNRPSQEYAMDTLHNGSQHISPLSPTQQLTTPQPPIMLPPILSVIPDSPFLVSRSLLVATPTIIPAVVTTNNCNLRHSGVAFLASCPASPGTPPPPIPSRPPWNGKNYSSASFSHVAP
ncbi:hypothetical protein BGZ96_001625 [Linnemannia gamsii]|uniref:Uncharacterized protein n=1 Tax=Linnemannia gamsii TaxID=64522 RepID=A0ABQ7KAB9_9FUNG|nr:hypothetical protein BGZ96_001625 [Linnemannia gamsii]